MSAMASQNSSISTVLAVCSVAHQRNHQSSASLAFVRGIHRWPVDSPHKGPVTRKIFPIWWRHHDQVISLYHGICRVCNNIPQRSQEVGRIHMYVNWSRQSCTDVASSCPRQKYKVNFSHPFEIDHHISRLALSFWWHWHANYFRWPGDQWIPLTKGQ